MHNKVSEALTCICGQVAHFVKQLDRDLTDRKKVAEIDMAPLLAGGYSTQLQAELSKKLRKPPSCAYEGMGSLFDAGLPGWTAEA